MKSLIVKSVLVLASCLGVMILSGCAGLISSIFADSVLYPERQPVVKNPADYGLQYQDITFKSSDNLDISGWLIPGQKN